MRGVGFKVRLEKFEIVNIVATGSLGKPVELERVYMRLPRSIYEPEQFPGLIYRMREPKVVLLIFASGKIVCTGAKTDTMVHEAVSKLWGTLDDYELFY